MNIQKGNILFLKLLLILFVCLKMTTKLAKTFDIFYEKQSLMYQLVFDMSLILAKSVYILKYD